MPSRLPPAGYVMSGYFRRDGTSSTRYKYPNLTEVIARFFLTWRLNAHARLRLVASKSLICTLYLYLNKYSTLYSSCTNNCTRCFTSLSRHHDNIIISKNSRTHDWVRMWVLYLKLQITLLSSRDFAGFQPSEQSCSVSLAWSLLGHLHTLQSEVINNRHSLFLNFMFKQQASTSGSSQWDNVQLASRPAIRVPKYRVLRTSSRRSCHRLPKNLVHIAHYFSVVFVHPSDETRR